MASSVENELVKVATAGPEIDGVVYDFPSSSKIIVAIVDPARGPVLRTYPAKSVTPRDDAGANDDALHALIRRSPPPRNGGGGHASEGSVRGRSGHARATGHRTTGK